MNLSQAVKLALGATLLEAVDPDESEAMYVGPKAKGWDALKNKFTSLFDKMERAEISDRTSGILKGQLDRDNAYKLEDVYSHPELYEQYPFLKDIDVYPVLGSKSSYQPGIINIGVTNYGTPSKSSYLHEIQHAIQKKEGWAKGGNPYQFYPEEAKSLVDKARREVSKQIAGIDKELNRIQKKYDKITNMMSSASRKGDVATAESLYNDPVRKKYNKLLDERGKLEESINNVSNPHSYNAYKNLAGEMEARDTASRMNLTQAQRASKAPYSSENINPKDAIVKFGVGGLAAGTTLSQAKRALAAKHKQMAEEQALEEAYSPVDMAIAGITGGATLGLKAVSALADPFINYAMDKMLGD